MNLVQMLKSGPVVRRRPDNRKELRRYIEQEFLEAMPDREFDTMELAQIMNRTVPNVCGYLRRMEQRRLVHFVEKRKTHYGTRNIWKKGAA